MNYTIEEIKIIVNALKQKKPWDSAYVTDVKRRIKDSYLNKPLPKCCYCLRDFTGEFRLDVDIEHILPKSIYKYCIFDLENLSVACKRCNMMLKRNDVKFLTINLLEKYGKQKYYYFNSKYYRFIHPNLDDVYEHMDFINTRINDFNFKKYTPKKNSKKGKYTYKYFELDKLESDSLTKIQGGYTAPKQTDLALEILDIFKKNGL